MALKLNEQAPDFTLPSTTGTDFRLSTNAANKPLIIYFYPKDFTPVCTKESCDFRDTFDFFSELGIDIVGISRDSIDTHLEFKKHFNLPFQLLADEKGIVADLYDATVPLIRFTKRITYLLDDQHKVIAAYENFFKSKGHITSMVEAVKKGARNAA